MKWINVNDRLPEEDQEVIVCNFIGEVFIDKYINDWGTWRIGDFDIEEISHWMPLPESPNRED
jgi:hypothetical protein